MMKRKSFRRPKVNCLCRCTSSEGVVSLTPSLVNLAKKDAINTMCASRSTNTIAAVAVRTGQLFEQTGHTLLAITVYRTAISCITSIDSFRAENYYQFGPLPSNPHHRYWSERINEADAIEVAERLDALYRRINLQGFAHQQRRIRWYYESLFRSVYSACM